MGKVLAEMLLVTCACYRNGEVTAEMPMCYRNGGQLLQKCTGVIPVTEMGCSFSRNACIIPVTEMGAVLAEMHMCYTCYRNGGSFSRNVRVILVTEMGASFSRNSQ